MKIQRRRSDRAGRAPLPSPGRPSVAGRDERRRFWAAVAAGSTSEDAALEAGVPPAVGIRWFRAAGGIPPAMFGRSARPLSGRHLYSPSGRRSRCCARRASQCRRLLVGLDGQRRRSHGSCGATLRLEVAAWSIARQQHNGTPSDPLADQNQGSLRSTRRCGPMWRSGWLAPSWLRAGHLSPVRWCTGKAGATDGGKIGGGQKPGVEQIARRLPVDFPDDDNMRISHEAIYQALFVQGRGALRRELTACLTGRPLRIPRARARGRGKAFISPEIMISKRPPEATDRAVPGHWEGDLILGLGSSAIGTLVERTVPLYTSEQFQKLMSDHGVVCSMSRSGNVWDNAAMESFFSSLKTERTARKTYRTRDQAKADVFDYIECFYNPKRRHSTIGYLSPVEFEMQAGFA